MPKAVFWHEFWGSEWVLATLNTAMFVILYQSIVFSLNSFDVA